MNQRISDLKGSHEMPKAAHHQTQEAPWHHLCQRALISYMGTAPSGTSYLLIVGQLRGLESCSLLLFLLNLLG